MGPPRGGRRAKRETHAVSSAFDRYLREIGSQPLLSREEEAELARRIRAGEQEALDRLVQGNLRFVVSIAKRYQNRGVALSDLVNEGNLGLIRAAGRYDERKGVRFISYAVWWIRQAILQAIAEGPGAGRRGEAPIRHVSLDTPLWESDEACLLDVVPDVESEGPEERANRQALRDVLDSSLTGLPEREERVLRLYFGLDDEEPLTLDEIGSRLRISRERARQLKERALARLRAGVRRSELESYYR